MISAQFEYVAPKSLDELHQLLSNETDKAILSGGHSLIALLKAEKLSPSLLISVDNISSLTGINSQPDASLTIGSATRLSDVADHQLIQQRYPAIIEAISLIGDRQYCNQTTIGDEYSYGRFSMGLLAVLLAYGATFNYSNEHSKQALSEPLGPQQKLILTTIELPSLSGLSSLQLVKNPSSSLPICGIASYLEFKEDTVKQARFSVCGQGLVVKRLPAIEAAVIGHLRSAALPASLFSAMVQEDDSGVSKEYLAHLSHLFVSKALHQKL
jgi:CO/xanthine dehydrogenase FAD-binding subunit